ncbi:MAG: ATP-grasp domain-containing protein [Candidatus Nanoarchaeia archaeon]|nr:ATP-grasp domain-containing protein [Candidatus Nanoarchaeia archaeon]
MKQVSVGYIFGSPYFTHEEDMFKKVAKRKNINLIFFNYEKELPEDELKKLAKQCDVVLNNNAGTMAIELSKTLEDMGKKVIDSSDVYYYLEDKWMFYLNCRKHKIPVPQTILLSNNLKTAKKELREFNYWPVVLKRVYGEMGEFVERATKPDEVVDIMKKLWDNRVERYPVIAQEYVKSLSYRVTLINGKIVQSALKKGKGWKLTGAYAYRCGKFKMDKEMKDIIKKLTKVCDIKICGIDFLRKDDRWLVGEVNAEPSLEFFRNDMERMVSEVLDYLRIEALKKHK